MSSSSDAKTTRFELSDGQKDFVAGVFGGVAQILAGHPFDTIKVRMQIPAENGKPRFTGAWECCKQTVKNEGVHGLYKGMSSPIAGVAAVNAVLFAAYGSAARFLQGDDENLSITNSILAGTFAGFVNCIVVSPVELVKSRLQIQYDAAPTKGHGLSSLIHRPGAPGQPPHPPTPSAAAARAFSTAATPSFGQKDHYSGPIDCAQKIVRANGYRGLFKGMSACIAREIPAYGAYFGSYEMARILFTPKGGTVDDLGPLALFFAGGLGGVGCWMFSYPQDLIKTRIQTQPDHLPPQFKSRWMDGGFVDCAKQIWRSEGMHGFWRGFAPTIARALPANGATFVVYEMAFRLLDSKL